MGSFLWFVLVVVLIIYAAYFAFINTAAAFFDSQTKNGDPLLVAQLDISLAMGLADPCHQCPPLGTCPLRHGRRCHLRLDHRVVDGTERRSGNDCER